jgi:hypothetical protein
MNYNYCITPSGDRLTAEQGKTINRGVHAGESGVKVKNESEAKVEKAWQK